MFDPVSPQGKVISDLFTFILLLGGLIFLLVAGLVIYAMVKYRHKPGDQAEPKQITGNTKLEIGWTIGPAIILVGLFIPTVLAFGAADPAKPANPQPEIVVVGHQWWWEYRYPSVGITTANELHIPVGRRVLVRFESADVQHDFWVPQLGRKIDMYPDKPNWLWLQADRPDTYLGNCSEYCGGQHAWMLLRVIAQPENEYNAWISSHSQAPPPPAAATNVSTTTAGQVSGNRERGRQIFLNNTCVNCHAIAGTTATAAVGPNLTYLGSRSVLGAGIIQNNPENLGKWIQNAQSIKPGVLMPAYRFSNEDLRDLVAYLLEEPRK